MPFAARLGDPVVHPLPPVLTGGPTAITVIIGGQPAWRGINPAAAAALQVAHASAQAAMAAATGPALPAAQAAATTTMTAAVTAAAGGSDIHGCATFVPPPVHGPGVVITPSMTVMIANFPAARMGDMILEAVGPPNSIAMGCPTVMIG